MASEGLGRRERGMAHGGGPGLGARRCATSQRSSLSRSGRLPATSKPERGLVVSVDDKHAGLTSPPSRLGSPLVQKLNREAEDAGPDDAGPECEAEPQNARPGISRQNARSPEPSGAKVREHLSFCIANWGSKPWVLDDRLACYSRVRTPGQTTPSRWPQPSASSKSIRLRGSNPGPTSRLAVMCSSHGGDPGRRGTSSGRRPSS